MRSQRAMITMPIAKKFGVPIPLRKSEKCTIVSIVLDFLFLEKA
jgi:hypothetical protein